MDKLTAHLALNNIELSLFSLETDLSTIQAKCVTARSKIQVLRELINQNGE